MVSAEKEVFECSELVKSRKVAHAYNYRSKRSEYFTPHSSLQETLPLNMRHRPNVGPMLGHRLRRWPSNGPTLGRCLVFGGLWHLVTSVSVMKVRRNKLHYHDIVYDCGGTQVEKGYLITECAMSWHLVIR